MDAVCLMGATKLYSEWAPGSFKICLSILCYCTGISYSSDFTWNLSRPISFLGFRALVLVAQQRLTMMVWMTRAFFVRMIKTHCGKLRNFTMLDDLSRTVCKQNCKFQPPNHKQKLLRNYRSGTGLFLNIVFDNFYSNYLSVFSCESISRISCLYTISMKWWDTRAVCWITETRADRPY